MLEGITSNPGRSPRRREPAQGGFDPGGEGGIPRSRAYSPQYRPGSSLQPNNDKSGASEGEQRLFVSHKMYLEPNNMAGRMH